MDCWFESSRVHHVAVSPLPSKQTVTMDGNVTPGPNDCTTLSDPCDWSTVNSTYLALSAAETAFFGLVLLVGPACPIPAALVSPQQCYAFQAPQGSWYDMGRCCNKLRAGSQQS